jgi:hypothetical protein
MDASTRTTFQIKTKEKAVAAEHDAGEVGVGIKLTEVPLVGMLVPRGRAAHAVLLERFF